MKIRHTKHTEPKTRGTHHPGRRAKAKPEAATVQSRKHKDSEGGAGLKSARDQSTELPQRRGGGRETRTALRRLVGARLDSSDARSEDLTAATVAVGVDAMATRRTARATACRREEAPTVCARVNQTDRQERGRGRPGRDSRHPPHEVDSHLARQCGLAMLSLPTTSCSIS